MAFAIDVLAYGRAIGEEVLGRIVPQNHHVGGALFFRFGPQTAFCEVHLSHVLHTMWSR